MAKKAKVAVVSNANAGKNTSRAGMGLVIGKILATPTYHYNTETLTALDKAAAEINDREPDVIAVVGGDGSLKQFVTRIIRERESNPGAKLPKILLIHTGTVGVVATALGLRGTNAVRLAEKMAAKISSGHPFDLAHLNPLHIIDDAGHDEYGFLVGAGLPVNLLTEYYKSPNRGSKGAFRVIMRTLRNELWSLMTFRKSKQLLTKPVHARISFPAGHNPPCGPYMTHTALMIGAVDEVGYGCRAMPDARSRPGNFMLRSSQLNFWGFLASAGAAWAGLPLPATFDAVVPEAVIDYAEPTIVTVDGEMNAPVMRQIITSGPTLPFITG